MSFAEARSQSGSLSRRRHERSIGVLLLAEHQEHRDILRDAFHGDHRFHVVDVMDLSNRRPPPWDLPFDVVVGYASTPRCCQYFKEMAEAHPDHVSILLMTPRPDLIQQARAEAIQRLEKIKQGVEVTPLIEVLHRQATPAAHGPRASSERDRERLAQLSKAELRVLTLTAEGLTMKEIAARLHRSVKTVANQRNSIMAKTGLRDRVRLTRFAIRVGLIAP